MKIKKYVILRLLEKYGGAVPLETAAAAVFGRSGELEQLRVIRLLNAYRAKDARFAHIRVRNKTICFVNARFYL
ncbi:MAG: hypothetical protein K6T65_08765 [Peptococcaceae bacterium]|nr:hypothetical protein [Peptococcaceae bacterium]